nr:hypothetical protein [Tanacetum cinerariifolium]
ELETKDGITRFVPISKNKKPQEESEATDVDLTVLALESPPDGFMSLSDGPYAPLDIGNESMTNVSLLESHDQSARLMEIHDPDALSSVSREPKAPFSVSDGLNASVSIHQDSDALSESQEFYEFFSDSHEPKSSFSVSHVAKDLFPVSQESRISYPGTSNEAAPQLSGEG